MPRNPEFDDERQPSKSDPGDLGFAGAPNADDAQDSNDVDPAETDFVPAERIGGEDEPGDDADFAKTVVPDSPVADDNEDFAKTVVPDMPVASDEDDFAKTVVPDPVASDDDGDGDDFAKTVVPEVPVDGDSDFAKTVVPDPPAASTDEDEEGPSLEGTWVLERPEDAESEASAEDEIDPDATWVPASDLTMNGLDNPQQDKSADDDNGGSDSSDASDDQAASLSDTWVPLADRPTDTDNESPQAEADEEDIDADKTWVPSKTPTHHEFSFDHGSDDDDAEIDPDQTVVPHTSKTVIGDSTVIKDKGNTKENDFEGTAVIDRSPEVDSTSGTVVIEGSDSAVTDTLAADVDPGMGETQFSQTMSGRDLSPKEFDEWRASIEEKIGVNDTDVLNLPDGNTQQTAIWARQSNDGLLNSLTIRNRPVDGDESFSDKLDSQEKPDYQIVEKLAEGGMGAIYVARQTSLDRELAIKTLKPMKPSELRTYQKQGRVSQVENQRREMFLSEALVTGNLVHPHIIPIHDLCQTGDGSPFYSMKRVYGTPWNERIVDMPLDESLEVLDKVCDAMAYAHHKGVINRDLKPENIMLGEFGEVLVLDWGLAVPATKEGKKQFKNPSAPFGAGTPAYMSPELWTGPAEAIGPWSDIYLLGAILFEIVTGKPPHDFPQPDSKAGNTGLWLVIDRVVRKNKIRPTDKTGELMDIAMKAMSTKAHARHETVLEFQEAVSAFRRHEESRRLAERAAETLAIPAQSDSNPSTDGQQSKSEPAQLDYQAYQTASALYEEAHNTWPENKAALQGLRQTRKDYAGLALAKGDYDLGLQVAQPETGGDFDQLKKKLTRARAIRNGLKTAMASAVMLIVGIGTFAIYKSIEVSRKNVEILQLVGTKEQLTKDVDAAVKQKAEAEKQAEAAAELVAEAKKQKAIVEKQLATAEVKKEEAEAKQKEANAALVDSQKKLQIADEQVVLAQMKIAEAEKKQAQADMDLALAKQEIDKASTDIASLTKEKDELDEAKVRANVELENASLSSFVRSADYSQALRKVEELLSEDSILLELPEEERVFRQRELKARRAQLIRRARRVDQPVQTQTISPNGKLLVLADATGQLTAWKMDPASKNFPDVPTASWKANQQVSNILFAEETVVVAAGTKISLWNPSSGDVKELPQHEVAVSALAIRENLLLSGDKNGTIRAWDVKDRKPLWKFQVNSGIRDLAVLAKSNAFIYAGSRGGESADVMAYRLPVADEVRPVRLGQLRFPRSNNNPPQRLAVSPDEGLLVISNSRNGDLLVIPKLKSPRSSKYDQFPFEHPSDLAKAQATNWRMDEHLRPINDLRFSADGSRLVSASDDRTVGIWNVADGKIELQLKMLGHGARVTSAAFLDDAGQLVSSTSADKFCRLWDVAAYPGERQRIQENFKAAALNHSLSDARNHDARYQFAKAPRKQSQSDEAGPVVINADGVQRGSINAIALNSTAERIVTGAADGTAVIWNTATGKAVGNASIKTTETAFSMFDEGHDFNMARLMFLPPHGQTLLTSGFDGTLCLWNAKLSDPARGAQFGRIPGLGLVNAVTTSKDGEWIATSQSRGPNGGAAIAIWKAASLLNDSDSKPHVVIEGFHDGDISSLSFSDDATRIASGARDGRVAVWVTDTGERLAGAQLHAKNTIVSTLQFLADDRLLTAGFDGKLLLVAIESPDANTKSVQKLTTVKRFAHDKIPIERVAMNSARSRFVTVSARTDKATRRTTSELQEWNVDDGKPLRNIAPAVIGGDAPNRIAAVTWSPSGDRLAAVVDDRLHVLATDTWRVKKVLAAPGLGISDATFAPTAAGDVLATFDGTAAHFWNMKDYTHIADFRPLQSIRSLALCEVDQKEFLLTGDRAVHIFEAGQADSANFGRTLSKISDPHGGQITSLSVNPLRSGEFLTAAADGGTGLWRWDTKTGKVTSGGTLSESTDQVATAIWSPTGDLGLIRSTGKMEFFRAGEASVSQQRPLLMRLESRRLMFASYEIGAKDGTVVHGEAIRFSVSDTEPVELLSGAWSPEGRFLVVAGRLKESGTSKAWIYNAADLSNLKMHASFTGHSAGGITAIGFLPNSPYVVTGGGDGAAYIWNYSPGRSTNASVYEAIQLLPDDADIAHSAPITSVAVSKSGKIIATASEDNRAIIWPNPLF